VNTPLYNERFNVVQRGRFLRAKPEGFLFFTRDITVSRIIEFLVSPNSSAAAENNLSTVFGSTIFCLAFAAFCISMYFKAIDVVAVFRL
jgi:hypothetical protein